MLSTSAEEYLGAIYRMAEEGESAGVSTLAERLGVTRVSANEMIRKLQKQGWLIYTPYKDIELTPKGTSRASDIVRRHRVWERFLVDVLQMPWDEAHEEATGLGHETSSRLVDRLTEYLGEPDTCPHGHPVPQPNGEVNEEQGRPLSELAPGQSAVVLRVPEEEPGMLTYLQRLGLRPDVPLTVEEIAPFEGPMTVRVADMQQVVGLKLASRIIVRVM
jgi:DtxR family Mn-dependent transcriptional regulator